MKNIIIYPHLPFNFADGGTTVQYELSKLISKFGINVKIFTNHGKTANSIFNQFTSDKNYDKDHTIVIYCEGIQGNPLNAKYVVRWMLSELGKNVPHDRVNSWSKNELVYYFNSEKKFEKNLKQVGTIYKTLTCIYINPYIKNYKNPSRKGYCHTFRKSHYHKTLKYAHPFNASLEITRNHTQIDCINIFNKREIFICYDPLTFLTVISAMCGCISVVIKVDGIANQSEWIKTTAVALYAKENKIDKLYGIAYGLDEINWARNTLPLVKDQWIKINEYFREKTIKPFLEDLKNIKGLENTIKNNFFKDK
jgi:hypothetical protein